MPDDIVRDWSLFFQRQVENNRRFGPVWRIPLCKRHTDLIQGASDLNILQKIELNGSNLDYRSLDPDRSLPHDYHSIEQVDRSFRMIWMFEVVEHVDLGDASDMLRRLHNLLDPGGILILSTPNGHHPHRFREPHHRTAFKFDSLAALVESSGFEVDRLYRIYNAPFLQRLTHSILLNWLHRFLDIDFARTLGLVAHRPS